MTTQQTTQSTPPVTPKSPVVQGGAPIEVRELAALFRGIIDPIAKSQEFAESEKTKRADIEARITATFLRYSFCLAAAILAIAVAALFLGKDQLSEKIVFAVIGFMGGFAFGKSAQSAKAT